MSKRLVSCIPFVLISILIIFPFLSACQIVESKSSDSDKLVNSMVYKFNSIAKFHNNDEKLTVNTSEGTISIELGSDFDISLQALCSVYTSNPDVYDEFDADKVRNDLISNTAQTATDYYNQSKEHYLYKLFLWCGQQALGNVMYVGAPEDEEEEKEILKKYEVSNFEVVRAQVNAEKEGTSSVYKFKWQQ